MTTTVKSNIPISRERHVSNHESPNRTTHHKVNSRTGSSLPRPLSSKSSKKDLWQEKTRLESALHTQENNCKALQTQLYAEKEQRSALETESKENEQRLKETIKDAQKRSDILESRVEAFEKKLLICNIDPVSLKSLEVSDEEREEVNRKAALAEGHAIVLRDKLKEFSENTSARLAVIQGISEDLDQVNSALESSELEFLQ